MDAYDLTNLVLPLLVMLGIFALSWTHRPVLGAVLGLVLPLTLSFFLLSTFADARCLAAYGDAARVEPDLCDNPAEGLWALVQMAVLASAWMGCCLASLARVLVGWLRMKPQLG